jgi:Carbohydrate binding domain
MKTKLTLAAFAALAMSVSAQNLLTNDNFETGVTGWTANAEASLTAFSFIGITVPQDGAAFAIFGDGNTLVDGARSQTVTLSLNTLYTFTGYATATIGFVGPSAVGMPFTANVFDDTNNVFFGNANGAIAAPGSWQQFSFSFNSGSSTSATVNLSGGGIDDQDLAFDNITLTAVPEASTALLSGLSVLGLALRRLRA